MFLRYSYRRQFRVQAKNIRVTKVRRPSTSFRRLAIKIIFLALSKLHAVLKNITHVMKLNWNTFSHKVT